MTDGRFAPRVLAWFDEHGRHDLPWQRKPSPYRVWVSEIMLQQTQVATVIPFYTRFMARFPDVLSLADAQPDEVLHHWSGLGYYARARNLHRAARTVRDEHGGSLPTRLDLLMALPGIGRSTAGAILALACGESHPILDGNVKRVLARYHAVDGWPGTRAVESQLWSLSAQHTPAVRVAEYTQAIMDLGATVCMRSSPACDRCPLSSDCRAHSENRQSALPGRRPRKALPVRETLMLLVRNAAGEVLLEQRPPAGVWGGLWSLPELEPGEDVSDWWGRRTGCRTHSVHTWPVHRHTFSHFHLDITPVVVQVDDRPERIMDAGKWVWYNTATPPRFGLAAPVTRLLQRLTAAEAQRFG